MASSPLVIHLFGPMHVLVQQEPLPRVRTRSVEWLLALLVLRHGRTVDRSWLAGTLWRNSEEGQALRNLREDLTRLRKALGDESARLQSPSRNMLTLDLQGAEVDLLAFDRAFRAGDEASLRSAVALYTGPLLEGCYEDWATQDRERREQECLNALETLAGRAEERGDLSDALALMRRAEGLDALRDSIQRSLMRVLAASGDTPSALMAYREHRLRLQREMNLEPDAETIRLYERIRRKTRASGAGDRVSKDTASDPQTTSKIGETKHEASDTRSSPLDTLPSTLPHPLTPLIGREQETTAIGDIISRSRLVTLVGAGGVGKTRLAIQVAGDLASDGIEEAAFVALAPLSDPALLPTIVARALGIREGPSAGPISPLETLITWFSNHSVLLVLDNCEHLIDAVASFTQVVLERCSNLHILATSRQRLGLSGEIVWRVPSLSFPEMERLSVDMPRAARAVLEYPAVQLFVERARMVFPRFQLATPQDSIAIAQICRQLDGIPLAIELASARVGILNVEQIASRLDDRFRLLTGGSRAALPRQQTLRSLIDWSYDLLDDKEKALFCRLSVFSGGWTLGAAESACAAPGSARDEERPGKREEGRGTPQHLRTLTP